jgi:hypothetical protein
MFKKENIYIIHTEDIDGVTRHFVSFKDYHNVSKEIEVSPDIYSVFEDFLRKEESIIRRDKRHIKRAVLTDVELYKRALNKPKSVEDEVIDNQRNEKLEQAISELTETMRRRFILYHDCGLTYERIARIENRNIRSVFDSIRAAEEKIREKMKNFES